MKLLRNVLLSLSVCLPLPLLASVLPDDPHIVVQGYGEVEALPDSAELRLQVSDTQSTASAAKANVDRRVAAVLAAARAQDIADTAIRASQIRVHPDYVWEDGKRRLRGQRVERHVDISLADLSRYGDLVDGLMAAGITELGQVQFVVADRDVLAERALLAAVADARQRATVLASNLGRKLGKVYRIDASSAPAVPRGNPGVMMMEAKASADAPMLLGKETVSSRLSLVFLLD